MFFKRNHQKQENEHRGQIFAAQNGNVIPVSQVSDEVFAQKVLGDGIAVQPESGTVASPVDGEVTNIARTYHAYGLRTSDGIELLVHIGINTVELEGKGFHNMVKVGQQVKMGMSLCTVDFSLLKESDYPTDIITLVTNMDDLKAPLKLHTDIHADKGKTCVIEYQI